ncbi:MAG: hypothetical protein OXT67_03320 [Zetaproteobacteria bacterium]|nr:hypothetical protein [Zetaproteobacteria bacterium]
MHYLVLLIWLTCFSSSVFAALPKDNFLQLLSKDLQEEILWKFLQSSGAEEFLQLVEVEPFKSLIPEMQHQARWRKTHAFLLTHKEALLEEAFQSGKDNHEPTYMNDFLVVEESLLSTFLQQQEQGLETPRDWERHGRSLLIALYLLRKKPLWMAQSVAQSTAAFVFVDHRDRSGEMAELSREAAYAVSVNRLRLFLRAVMPGGCFGAYVQRAEELARCWVTSLYAKHAKFDAAYAFKRREHSRYSRNSSLVIYQVAEVAVWLEFLGGMLQKGFAEAYHVVADYLNKVPAGATEAAAWFESDQHLCEAIDKHLGMQVNLDQVAHGSVALEEDQPHDKFFKWMLEQLVRIHHQIHHLS